MRGKLSSEAGGPMQSFLGARHAEKNEKDYLMTLGDDMSMRSESVFDDQNNQYGFKIDEERNSDEGSVRNYSLNYESNTLFQNEISPDKSKKTLRRSFNLGSIFRRMKFDKMMSSKQSKLNADDSHHNMMSS